MNIRDAKFVTNPDGRLQPTATRCGYVPVFAVAPGCIPVAVGAFSTRLWRGEVRYLVASGKPLKLEEALAEMKAAHPGNYPMTPMSAEMVAIVAGEAR